MGVWLGLGGEVGGEVFVQFFGKLFAVNGFHHPKPWAFCEDKSVLVKTVASVELRGVRKSFLTLLDWQ